MTIVSVHRRLANRVALSATLFVLCLLAGCGGSSFAGIFVTPSEEGLSQITLDAIVRAQNELEASPGNADAFFTLSSYYLQAIRENADTAYYGRIEKLMDLLKRRDPDNADIPFLLGSVAAGRHDFHAALDYAQPLVTAYPDIPRYLGLLADAQIELGMYAEAAQSLQTMSDLRPDSNAFTRIAYLREIHGDIPGAVEAMQDALEGGGHPENIAWQLTETARLVQSADPAAAATLYASALKTFPSFAPALAGLARTDMLLGKPDDARTHAKEAIALLPLPEYPALLGDIEASQGNTGQAAAQFTLVQIGYDAITQRGTNVELERTRFLVDHDLDLPAALERARAVYADRPTIYAADLLAWALYKNDKAAEAAGYVTKALATGSHDPMILYHAGVIAKANGKPAEARRHFDVIKREAPHFSFIYNKDLERQLHN